MPAKVLFMLLVWATFLDRNIPENDITACELQFEVVNAGFNVTGSLDATILTGRFDPSKLSESNIIILADPSTIKTGIAMRDRHLQGRDYFNTKDFTKIKIKSKAFRKLGRNKYAAILELTIKEKTKVIEVPFAMQEKKGKVYYVGSFSIDRIEFGIGEPSITLANEVTVHFRLF
jgi:polyisoprenoid-binding protein YceI